jgi:hypothetical protein
MGASQIYSADIGRTLPARGTTRVMIEEPRHLLSPDTLLSLGCRLSRRASRAASEGSTRPRHHGQPLVAIVRRGARVTGSRNDWQCAADGSQPKGDQPLCSGAIRYAHTCRRRCQPIQGIPISSRELGVARSVFDAQWFVKQPLQRRTKLNRNRTRINAENSQLAVAVCAKKRRVCSQYSIQKSACALVLWVGQELLGRTLFDQ